MSRFPTAGHLVSWAKYAPGVKESAGKKKGKNSTGHGNTCLAPILGNAAAAAGTTGSLLREPGSAQRSAACCRAPGNSPIFGLAGYTRSIY